MENSDNWINDAFNSVKNQKQPVLAAELFAKIEDKIAEPAAKVVSFFNWKIAAAACIIFAINLLAFQEINTNKEEMNADENELITDYNIYAK